MYLCNLAEWYLGVYRLRELDGFEDLVCLTEMSLVLMNKLEIRGEDNSVGDEILT